MTLDQMLTDLNKRIGSTPEVDNTNMATWLNQAYLSFCNTYDFTWLEETTTDSPIEGHDTYSLPSNCKMVIELKINDERYTYVPFEQRDLKDASEYWFTILGNNYIINPTPTTTGSADIDLVYIKRASKMVEGSDSPDLLPEVYHEALVIYAFSIYNTYDEEHDEARALMGNELRPSPGTFYWYVQMAKKEEQRKKRGARRRMLGTKEYYGKDTSTTTVLGN